MAVHEPPEIASLGKQQEKIAIAFLILAWSFVSLRIWTRTYVIANFVYCVAILFLDAHGGGTHVTSVSQMLALTKWVIIGEATYIITVMILKVSLGIFFARIVVKPWQLWTIYINVAVNIVSSMVSFFYVIFRCGANLDVYVYRQLANECAPRPLDRFFAYQQASFTTLTDCIFASFPIFILWNASMDIRSKISVGFILSLAALGCICSIIRFQYVDGLTQIEDFFWNATNVAIWSIIESGAGIVAGCLATLRPFLKRSFITAQPIRSSTFKYVSRLFRSNVGNSNKEYAQRARGRGVYGQHSEAFELKSDASKKGESTDSILTQTEDINGPWPSRPDIEGSRNLELDRKSSRTTRNRAVSDVRSSLNRPLPPISPDAST
ncbi:hypothetical protein K469DRAFT_726006 [Zopfia rhizophila CBS 207.26]|uniref:Rhodopsin domain-containing protein n=1 Tax=Zopfia rhizophila CBS 207.26 TaxID=1314779 RepID=A0A6A6EUA6_9PEZI|nr:hypothetical protein K469DRAFT_726006 [Zopfia rhizophila CBS 207.26]